MDNMTYYIICHEVVAVVNNRKQWPNGEYVKTHPCDVEEDKLELTERECHFNYLVNDISSSS